MSHDSETGCQPRRVAAFMDCKSWRLQDNEHGGHKEICCDNGRHPGTPIIKSLISDGQRITQISVGYRQKKIPRHDGWPGDSVFHLEKGRTIQSLRRKNCTNRHEADPLLNRISHPHGMCGRAYNICLYCCQ